MADGSVVPKYYAYQATTTFGFFGPVFTLFLLHRGLTYTQIGLLSAISAGLVLASEIPTGYVGDRVGRRNALVLSSVLLSVSLLGFILAHGFPAFVALYVLWALGLAFRSGSADAWLYDALDAADRSEDYTRVRGRGGSVGHWTSAATMLAAGLLYELEPWLPFLAGAGLVATSIPVLLTMPATGRHYEAADSSVRADLRVLREHLTEPPLRSFVASVALFFGVLSAADTFIQPLAVAQGLPEPWLGPLYAGFTVVAAVASYYAGDLEALLSTRWAAVIVPGVTVVFFVVPLALPLAVFPLFFAMKAARSVMTPIASAYVNDHAASAQRATVLSAASMVYALVRLPLKPFAGMLADATTLLLTLAALGASFVLGALLLTAVEKPPPVVNSVR